MSALDDCHGVQGTGIDLPDVATDIQAPNWLDIRTAGQTDKDSDPAADQVGQVCRLNPETNELRNMWMPTGQPGLWFTAGSLSHCRIYSKYLAMQIQQAG